ncbi:MAG: hypothetical protein IJ876_05145 [Elusimicrobiaceae bacterium]|nr:hypothetical protein [Elusimicrobiaceae bacterium]
MKKILFLAILLGIAPLSLFAGEMTGIAEYTGSSDFNRVKAGAQWQFGLNWSVGAEGKFADEQIFKDPIYAVKLPIAFRTDAVSFNMAPFYYFKNKSDKNEYNAFGISGKLVMTLEDDAINELYSHAYIGAAFARQQGLRTMDSGSVSDQYYSQAAYTLGLHKNFYRAFSFEAIGTAFQYPDGITGVTAFRGILDQQDLVALQSYDIVHELPKYTAAARMTRLWADRRATLYLSYRFGEFYTADPEHAFVLGNTFTLTEWAVCDLAYNHLRTVHNENKRDIFHAQLRVVF